MKKYFYIIYTVVHNYYHDSTKDEIRASIQRTFDQGSNALKIGELMDKHGSKEWLGPLMEEVRINFASSVHIADIRSAGSLHPAPNR